ncbi:retrovirus-related pol polyprotein from transposon TNT 1-94, partial [Tanacetum coccineum]
MAIDTNVTAPMNNFKRWKQKMFFYLITLNFARFLNETAPQVEPPTEGQPSNAQITTAKELWESLERKYKTEDAGTKKFVAPDSAKANMVEHAGSSSKSNSKAKGKGKKKNDKKSKGKAKYLAPKAGIVKQKFQGTCYNYDQPGHRAANCKMPKRVNPRQANMVNDSIDMIAMVFDVIAMISEVNLVGSNNSGWWVDTEATRHVCADKSMFYSLRAVDNAEKLYMGNSATADIKGEGDVILKMTFEKELKLTNVLYVPEIRKNLDQMYVRKGYAVNGMFKLNVMVFKNDINKMNSSAYLIESANMWHSRLGQNSSAYRFIVHDSKNLDIQKNAVMESRNASFFENIFPCLTKEIRSSSRLDDEVVQDKRQQDDNDLHDEKQDQLEEEEVEQRRSKRDRTKKSFMVENEPKSYREAVTSSEGHQWKEAIKSIIDSILQNHTWELVDLPPGYKPIRYKWIFKMTMKADETIDKYKARLVIKGYRQREGLDYFDTYSLVTRITSIRMVLAITTLRNLEVHQMDVKKAFLNRDLEEEIYMNQPEGFIAPRQERKVYRLVNNDKMIKSTKDMLKSKFDMKDMGLADVILGIKIIRTHNGLVLSQAHYMDKILNTHNAGDFGLARTPIDTSSRPDLAYAVSRLSRYTSNPSVAHWKAMTRVLHYLRYNRDYGLHYDRYPVVIEGYNNANWISDIKDSRSTSEYVFTLGGAAISWNSSKKTVIAKSTLESEFIALDKCREEADWLRQFIKDIPRWPKPVTAISIHCDSQSAIGRAHSIMYYGKSRYIRRRHNSIR